MRFHLPDIEPRHRLAACRGRQDRLLPVGDIGQFARTSARVPRSCSTPSSQSALKTSLWSGCSFTAAPLSCMNFRASPQGLANFLCRKEMTAPFGPASTCAMPARRQSYLSPRRSGDASPRPARAQNDRPAQLKSFRDQHSHAGRTGAGRGRAAPASPARSRRVVSTGNPT